MFLSFSSLPCRDERGKERSGGVVVVVVVVVAVDSSALCRAEHAPKTKSPGQPKEGGKLFGLARAQLSHLSPPLASASPLRSTAFFFPPILSSLLCPTTRLSAPSAWPNPP